jgi:hypothetical protein
MEFARPELSDSPVEGALATSSIGSSNWSRSMNSPINDIRNGPRSRKKYLAKCSTKRRICTVEAPPSRANVSEINDIKNWNTNRFALFGNAKGVLHPAPRRDTLHAVRLVAYRAYTFAFHHHLDQRCQCRKLARLPQGFLPLLHIGTQAASAVLQCLPPLCRQCLPPLCRRVAFPVRVLLVSGPPESQNAAACDHRRRSRHKTAKEVEARRTAFIGSCE